MAVSFSTAASANATSVAITTPAAGDFIIVFAFNNASTTFPTLPTGYRNGGNQSTVGTAGQIGFKVSNGTETTTSIWTNATNIVCAVYKGVSGDSLFFASGVGSSATITYPLINLINTTGTSWVVAAAIEKSATAGMNGTTAALVSNRTSQTTVNLLDTNGGVAGSSLAAQTLTVTTTGRFIAFCCELPPAPVGGFDDFYSPPRPINPEPVICVW